MSIRITAIEAERFKRIKAVVLEPTAAGLTVIGGRNAQGKTSVLDAIAYALGGDKRKPTGAQHRGAEKPPYLRIELSNGLLVERKGKNSALTVSDPAGLKGTQSVLNGFVEALALDLPKFMAATPKEKASTLLKIIGADDKLAAFDADEKESYAHRTVSGRLAETAEAELAGMPSYEDMPADVISIVDLTNEIAAAEELERQRIDYNLQHTDATTRIADLQEQLEATQIEREIIETERAKLVVPDVADLRAQVETAEDDNEKVRANERRAEKRKDVRTKRLAHTALDDHIIEIREKRAALLDGVDMPLPGLTIADGELEYNGARWDCMSGAEQMKVGASIVQRLNSKCGFVLIDKLEMMDLETLEEFGEWAAERGLQIIATRVSTGDECTVIIEDGMEAGTEGDND